MAARLLKFIFVSLISLQLFAQNPSYREWGWKKSDCKNCWIVFKIDKEHSENKELIRFVETIERSKFDIIKLYNSDAQEYNLLAHMAIGILGNESEFFTNWRYQLKKNSQLAITASKTAKTIYKKGNKYDYANLLSMNPLFVGAELAKFTSMTSANSKGPTQIKNVPDKIEQFYKISESDLWIPENAARATMGYLIEALQQLKNTVRNNNLTYITSDQIVDYLPYIYFGRSKMLRDGTATPQTNIYVKQMKKYMKIARPFEVY